MLKRPSILFSTNHQITTIIIKIILINNNNSNNNNSNNNNDNNNINEEEQVENNGMDAEQIKLSREKLAEEDQDLKEIFIILTHSSLLQIESREKLPKANFDNQLKESANRVLDIYLKEVDTIPGICDKIYAIGRAIVFKLGKLVESGSGERKKKSAIRGNRWE